jgi:hypothetical protein
VKLTTGLCTGNVDLLELYPTFQISVHLRGVVFGHMQHLKRFTLQKLLVSELVLDRNRKPMGIV